MFTPVHITGLVTSRLCNEECRGTPVTLLTTTVPHAPTVFFAVVLLPHRGGRLRPGDRAGLRTSTGASSCKSSMSCHVPSCGSKPCHLTRNCTVPSSLHRHSWNDSTSKRWQSFTEVRWSRSVTLKSAPPNRFILLQCTFLTSLSGRPSN